MGEWAAQWNLYVYTLVFSAINLAMVIWNFLWGRKVRREDQSEKLEKRMTDLFRNVDNKVVALGREVSEIQGHLAITQRHKP